MFIHKRHNLDLIWLTDDLDEVEKLLASGINPKDNPFHAYHKVVSKDGVEFHLIITSSQIDGHNDDPDYCLDFFRDFVLEDPWFADIELGPDGDAEEEAEGEENERDEE